MDVLGVIKQEHRAVGKLIDEADACDPGDPRLVELATEIEQKLSEHLDIEERLFYAQLRKRSEGQSEQVEVFEAYTEHAVAKTLIEMLRSGRKSDEHFKAELQVLGESVKHHVQEEESKVFDIAREILDQDELEEIGASWERAKQRAQKPSSNGAVRAGARKKTARRAAPRSKAQASRRR